MKNIFQSIRESCAFVAKQAEHVEINLPLIEEYAQELQLIKEEETYDTDHHHVGNEEKTAAYAMLLNAINFGSGSFPDVEEEGLKPEKGSCYLVIARNLKNFFETEPDITTDLIRSKQDEDWAKILGLDYNKTASRVLAEQYKSALHDFSQWIATSFDHSFYAVVEAADGKAANLVSMLAERTKFHDVHTYKDEDVFLLKRAQCMAADLYQGFKHLDQREIFSDISDLTMLADCDLPHVLRMDDLLYYSPQLEGKVFGGEFIQSGSQEEIELRACALHAVELIAAVKGAKAIDIDHALWHRKQEERYRDAELKPHKTLTHFY